MVNRYPQAHLSMLAATILFGANYWIAKGLMPEHLLPMQIIFLRVSGTVLIATLIQLFVKELRSLKIDRSDFPRLVVSGFLGVSLNQIMFFTGLNLTTPVDAAIINSINPILVLIFAGFILKDSINITRLSGIILGATGALILIIFGNPLSLGEGHLSGNLFIIINTASWSLYLVISKPLMVKYNPLVLMRWIFTFGLIGVFPFTINDALEINFSTFLPSTWFAIIYIVLGTTFLAYFFITFSLKRLSASVVAYYTYLQPVLVALIGIILFTEKVSWIKVISAVLVFAGIYFVTRNEKFKKINSKK